MVETLPSFWCVVNIERRGGKVFHHSISIQPPTPTSCQKEGRGGEGSGNKLDHTACVRIIVEIWHGGEGWKGGKGGGGETGLMVEVSRG